MALTAFTGTVSAATLLANFDDKTTALTTQAVAGAKDHQVDVDRVSLADTTDESLRSVTFTPQDDMELRAIGVTAVDATASRTITMAVSVADGDDDFLLEKTVSVSVTTVVGTAHARKDYRTTTGDRLTLLKGVRYKLTLSNASTGTTATRAYGWVLLRAKRRRA